MSIIIRYPRGKEGMRQAALDMVQYVGMKRAILLGRVARQTEMTYPKFAMIASFAGVQGRPVQCFYNRMRSL